MRFLEKGLVKVGAKAADAEDAIKQAGVLLADAKTVEDVYIDAMVQSFQENGPYFVLAPHIAIPHARPEDGVKEASVSLLQLKEPITFGHSSNDPVQLIFGLGASSSEEHIDLLKKLTQLLNKEENVNQLRTAASYHDIKTIIEMEENK
ncbi:PTS sugar transporter subunit IIA [Sediminibacillus albus]|uniref:PTS system, mannitol-specific IIA component/PTS system, ascorbate-specific IIA component n=1 Tax=Sediminibacillus albus TaxID=407036 RepID=A0A1G8Y7T7_9BACI|nr:PTS sugar transporter subunit IIA [Sediminibacillus albus]SDJ98265.1 PTS system, mannitol-specific IIA component/PTS system, ascorbate-specific IIA component [Sediminibacillus albus]